MNLVDKKNDVAVRLDLVNEVFDSAFKLTSELRSGNKCGQVEQMDLFFGKLCRNLAARNFERKTFCNCGFADTGFTDKAGIVF